jgi:hypothetical protein
MTKAFIMDFEGGTAAQYDAVIEDMGLAGPGVPTPAGALFHGAGPTESGWRVVDVWEDPEAYARFAAEQIGPLGAKHGLSAPAVQALDVEQIRRGSDDPVSYLQIVRIPGLDRAGFEHLDSHVLEDGVVPAACVFHVNGSIDGGSFVIDYWTTKAERDRFGEERIKPGVQAAGVTSMPTFETLDLHNSMRAVTAGASA